MGEVVWSIKIQETAFFLFQSKVVLMRLDAESMREDYSMLVQRVSVLRTEILFFHT